MKINRRKCKTSNFIIFLDFDGVIATHKSYISSTRRSDKIDRECIKVLNTLVKKLNAVIVVSSTWSILYTVKELQEILDTAGFNGKIIDKTSRVKKPRWNISQRGAEIQQWIKKNGCDDYLVIDDEIFDIKDYIPMDKVIYVKNGFIKDGLTYSHIDNYMRNNR